MLSLQVLQFIKDILLIPHHMSIQCDFLEDNSSQSEFSDDCGTQKRYVDVKGSIFALRVRTRTMLGTFGFCLVSLMERERESGEYRLRGDER